MQWFNLLILQARSFGVMTQSEVMKVRDLVTRTTEVLNRASAGPDDIGSRYSRLLELLWQTKPAPMDSPAETRQSNDLPIQNTTLPSCLPEHNEYVHFSPANDFSWLDLEAVGDYVSGDLISGAGPLGFDALQNSDFTQTPAGQDRSQFLPVSASSGDMSSLLF